MKRHLGMYVHAHWAYSHPYAARTWSIDDWRGYATGLAALGYDLIMIWPMLEIIPAPPTASDAAYLSKIRQVIDILHSELGMKALITMGPNTVANETARRYAFEERPFFGSDVRLNPGDPVELDRLMRLRRAQLAYLSKADGFVAIDSDPGGYAGSTNEEFANLLTRYMNLIGDLNPEAKLYYWMWVGWEAYNQFWQQVDESRDITISWSASDCEYAVRALMNSGSDSWGLFACVPMHQEIVARLGVENRAIFLPYGLVEGEPSFPLTGLNVNGINEGVRPYCSNRSYAGAMGNAQTHAVQLPNTYLFSHFAQGGDVGTVDLVGFAEKLVPGCGESIADAWEALQCDDLLRARETADRVEKAASLEPKPGPLAGLLLGSPSRFLTDLAMQLRFRADMLEFVSGADPKASLAALTKSWGAWIDRTGFVDAYCGPFAHILHPALRGLHDAAIDAALDDFDEWRNPSLRHGAVIRLLGAMKPKLASSSDPASRRAG